ncbi:hypothetical protein [Francisella tularensis]|uniref:hypothetical protein n=1 Tax=Francisella tularensis TaxID=263 RepID=UPI0008F4BC2E|nr:hypothetical protein [Francisella tularensis]APA83274.1 hypothetical protein N894_1290 [Francisella tularensis subsp. novicida PA10-7858]
MINKFISRGKFQYYNIKYKKIFCDFPVYSIDDNNYCISTGVSFVYIVNNRYTAETVGFNEDYFKKLVKNKCKFEDSDFRKILKKGNHNEIHN